MGSSLNKYLFISLLAFWASFSTLGQNTEDHSKVFDIVIIGGTPAGIMAAIAGDREGKSSIIIERSKHLGGLPANGLGATDLDTRGAVGGLFKTFIDQVKEYYKKNYGENSSQYQDCDDGYHFEPSVAEQVLMNMIANHPKITALTYHQFDALPKNVSKTRSKISSIWITDRHTNTKKRIKGRVFIDATYEGDLIAAAGVPYAIGRESKSEFNEPFAGKVYKYWNGPAGEGSTYKGDKAIQAYNYRLCLTTNQGAFVKIEKPKNYDRNEYTSLINDVETGRNASYEYHNYIESGNHKLEEFKEELHFKPHVPGNQEGIHKLVNMITLPNDKSDANNQHLAFLSTDLPEENWKWPSSDWIWRDAFAERLKEYTLGLLYFAQNDDELPHWFKKKTAQWGLDKFEYQDNGFFPRQVYVREGRRMKGLYFYTAHDALPINESSRPPIHKTSISSGHYSIDSHGIRKREEDRAHLEGFLSYETKPFTIPFGVIVPKNITNLISPVPISGTHLGFSALRMEPTWMAFGEAAGLAAHLCLKYQKPIQEIPIGALQIHLLDYGAVLIYFKDINVNQVGFKGFQILALNSIITSWNADPDELVTEDLISKINEVLGLKLDFNTFKNSPRTELAETVFKLYKEQLK